MKDMEEINGNVIAPNFSSIFSLFLNKTYINSMGIKINLDLS